MIRKIICKHNFVIGSKPELHNGQLMTDIICTKCGRRHNMQPVHNNKNLEEEKIVCYQIENLITK